jgi:hypothetical protein
MEVDYSATQLHTIRLNVAMQANNDHTYHEPLSLLVRAPEPEVDSYSIDDPEPNGNGNGYVEPGETIEMQVSVANVGEGPLDGLTAFLLDTDPNVTVLEGEQSLDELLPGQVAPLNGPFVFEVAEELPFAEVLELPIRFEAEGSVVGQDTISLIVGTVAFIETFQDSVSMNANWLSVAWPWHLSDVDYVSAPFSLRWFYEPLGSYPPNTTSIMISEMFPLQGNANLTLRAKHDLAAGDTLHLRVNFPGIASIVVGQLTGDSRGHFQQYSFPVETPEDAEDAMLFFMARSDGSQQGPGVMLDEIMVFDNTSSSPETNEAGLPAEFALHGPYPNPFNPSGTVSFDLPRPATVDIRVFDLLGREVAVLQRGELPGGTHSVTWNANARASGVYFIQMEAGPFRAVRKAVLLK